MKKKQSKKKKRNENKARGRVDFVSHLLKTALKVGSILSFAVPQ